MITRSMNAPEFIELVRRMREAQRGYFQYRTPEQLRHAKDLEEKVDAAIDELLGPASLSSCGFGGSVC